jgi:hypothetical protein
VVPALKLEVADVSPRDGVGALRLSHVRHERARFARHAGAQEDGGELAAHRDVIREQAHDHAHMRYGIRRAFLIGCNIRPQLPCRGHCRSHANSRLGRFVGLFVAFGRDQQFGQDEMPVAVLGRQSDGALRRGFRRFQVPQCLVREREIAEQQRVARESRRGLQQGRPGLRGLAVVDLRQRQELYGIARRRVHVEPSSGVVRERTPLPYRGVRLRDFEPVDIPAGLRSGRRYHLAFAPQPCNVVARHDDVDALARAQDAGRNADEAALRIEQPAAARSWRDGRARNDALLLAHGRDGAGYALAHRQSEPERVADREDVLAAGDSGTRPDFHGRAREAGHEQQAQVRLRQPARRGRLALRAAAGHHAYGPRIVCHVAVGNDFPGRHDHAARLAIRHARRIVDFHGDYGRADLLEDAARVLRFGGARQQERNEQQVSHRAAHLLVAGTSAKGRKFSR